ncbi:MAG: alpha/beta fold hydrolase [Gemmatimonadales bacterium]|nr:MAG: alpha/beta fold hydrolase [Gemmatimonadales bacterium]
MPRRRPPWLPSPPRRLPVALLSLLLVGVPGLLTPAPAPLAQEPSDPVEGSWTGILELPGGQELPIVFHILRELDGTYTATMDSPAQGAFGMPVASVAVAGDSVTLELPPLQARYRGAVTAPNRMEGEWEQGPMAFPLPLERGEATGEFARPPRPQDPEPPFPYRAEDVRYPNPEAGIELAGTLTVPEGEGPFPAVALITGSGAQDRDQSILGHRPFLVLADHLTRQGIAVLRSDDRGVGESGGDFTSATSRDFAGDAAAAVAYLRSRPEVDQERVGLVGHSEGGVIAPMVAVEWGGVDFVVLLASPGLPGAELLAMQGAAIGRAMGVSDEAIQESARIQAAFFQIILEEDDPDLRVERAEALLRQVVAESDPDERAAQGIPPGGEEAWIAGQLQMAGSEWLRFFLAYDPREHLTRLEIPALALLAGKDTQVPAEENRPELEWALAGAPGAEVRILPGLNHLFQTAETGAPAEYAQIEETFAPAALEAVAAWILAR